MGCLFLGSLFFRKTGFTEVRGVLGGPDSPPPLISSAEGAELAQSAALGGSMTEGALLGSDSGALGYPSVGLADAVSSDRATMKDPGAPNAIQAPDLDVPTALPNLNSKFIMPAKGYDWGILHNYNAVDIANHCGTPVVAAAEGLIVPDPNITNVTDGWNDGYGNFVLIEHPFGDDVLTRYAHLEKALVQIGSYVKQGQEIGLMGETGDATGCHVHFEVIGAHNPFAKN